MPVCVLNVTKETIKIHSRQTLGLFTEISDGDVLVSSVTDPVKVESTRENPVTQVTLDSQLTADQKAKLLKLLNKLRGVFARPGNEGCSTTVTHRIPLVDETPVMRSWQVPTLWRAEVNREIKRLD